MFCLGHDTAGADNSRKLRWERSLSHGTLERRMECIADTGCRCKWRKLATGWAVDLFGEHRHATHHYWFRPESGARFFCTHGTESERSISFAYAIECTCRSSSSGFSFLFGHNQLSPSTRERRRMFTSRVECGVWPISAAWIHNAGIRQLCNESSSSFAKPFATGIQFKLVLFITLDNCSVTNCNLPAAIPRRPRRQIDYEQRRLNVEQVSSSSSVCTPKTETCNKITVNLVHGFDFLVWVYPLSDPLTSDCRVRSPYVIKR